MTTNGRRPTMGIAAALAGLRGSLGKDVRQAVSLYFSPLAALRRDFAESMRRLRTFETGVGSGRPRAR